MLNFYLRYKRLCGILEKCHGLKVIDWTEELLVVECSNLRQTDEQTKLEIRCRLETDSDSNTRLKSVQVLCTCYIIHI